MPNCDGCGPKDGSNNKENFKSCCKDAESTESKEKPGCCGSKKSCCNTNNSEELSLDEREARLIKRLEEIRKKKKSLEQGSEIE